MSTATWVVCKYLIPLHLNFQIIFGRPSISKEKETAMNWKKKKSPHTQLKAWIWSYQKTTLKASKNMGIRLISNYSEISEGDRVTNKISSTIWYSPIKYNRLHIKSLYLHPKYSDLATELLRVQLGLKQSRWGKGRNN